MIISGHCRGETGGEVSLVPLKPSCKALEALVARLKDLGVLKRPSGVCGDVTLSRKSSYSCHISSSVNFEPGDGRTAVTAAKLPPSALPEDTETSEPFLGLNERNSF